MAIYSFIESQREYHSVELMCELLKVSRTGPPGGAYYAFRNGESYKQSQQELETEKAFVASFWEHKRRYGVRRLVPELQEKGIGISYHQGRKIMRKWGLKAIQRHRPSDTLFHSSHTDSRHSYSISANLLMERPFPIAVNEVWVGDITARAAPVYPFERQLLGLSGRLDGSLLQKYRGLVPFRSYA